MRRILVAAALLMLPPPATSYSVLTHEAIIDAAWDKDIVPVLQKRFPDASPEDLNHAHAYAYGGCILQDMGYYPFGSKFFSDLLHYVRSADFVEAMFHQSQTLNDYAFAYGTLAHYFADINGHSLAVNRAVPIEYPKLRRKHGNVVTYEQDPAAHIKTEFGFDVLQVAHGRYAPQAYHDFIGFEVDKELIDRALGETYGLGLDDIFGAKPIAFGSYRHAVSKTIPLATRVAWQLKKNEIVKEQPGITRRKFLYNLRQSSYEKEWGRDYSKPGLKARVLAVVVKLIPKVGPFKALSFRPPTPATAQMFAASFNKTLDAYRAAVPQAAAGKLQLADVNLDTGKAVAPGSYELEDKAYFTLVKKLAEKDLSGIPVATRQNILEFYSHWSAPAVTETKSKKEEDWSGLQAALDKLKATP